MKNNLTIRTIRVANQSNIIKSIIKCKGILRSELADANSISLMTVKNIVEELRKNGIVVENVSNTSIGRKPKALSISPKYGSIACINLTSKDFFSYIIYDIYGEIVEKRQQRIEGQYTYLGNLQRLIEQLKLDLAKTGKITVGFGLSVPSAYYEELDLVNHDLIADFKDLHLRELFFSEFGEANIMVTHDVFTAAQAEYGFVSPKAGSLFYFYIGDGVGGAFIHNGEPLLGENLVAGEVGQFIVRTDEGEMALEKATSIPQLLAEVRQEYPCISFYNVLKLYDEGDTFVVSIVDRKLKLLTTCLYNIAWVLNPCRIVVDSSYKKFADLIAKAANRYAERLKDLPIHTSMSVFSSELNNHSAMQGCFDLLLNGWIESVASNNPVQ